MIWIFQGAIGTVGVVGVSGGSLSCQHCLATFALLPYLFFERQNHQLNLHHKAMRLAIKVRQVADKAVDRVSLDLKGIVDVLKNSYGMLQDRDLVVKRHEAEITHDHSCRKSGPLSECHIISSGTTSVFILVDTLFQAPDRPAGGSRRSHGPPDERGRVLYLASRTERPGGVRQHGSEAPLDVCDGCKFSNHDKTSYNLGRSASHGVTVPRANRYPFKSYSGLPIWRLRYGGLLGVGPPLRC